MSVKFYSRQNNFIKSQQKHFHNGWDWLPDWRLLNKVYFYDWRSFRTDDDGGVCCLVQQIWYREGGGRNLPETIFCKRVFITSTTGSSTTRRTNKSFATSFMFLYSPLVYKTPVVSSRIVREWLPLLFLDI